MTSLRWTLPAIAALLLVCSACSGDTKTTEIVKTEIPACSASYPTGTCDAGNSCFQGACVATASLCSPTNLAGTCASGLVCYGGGCVLPSVVPPDRAGPRLLRQGQHRPAGPRLRARQAHQGRRRRVHLQRRRHGHRVEVPYTQKAKITVDGLDFRDLNGNGTLEKYEDWRYPDICRAQDLVAAHDRPAEGRPHELRRHPRQRLRRRLHRRLHRAEHRRRATTARGSPAAASPPRRWPPTSTTSRRCARGSPSASRRSSPPTRSTTPAAR